MSSHIPLLAVLKAPHPGSVPLYISCIFSLGVQRVLLLRFRKVMWTSRCVSVVASWMWILSILWACTCWVNSGCKVAIVDSKFHSILSHRGDAPLGVSVRMFSESFIGSGKTPSQVYYGHKRDNELSSSIHLSASGLWLQCNQLPPVPAAMSSPSSWTVSLQTVSPNQFYPPQVAFASVLS